MKLVALSKQVYAMQGNEEPDHMRENAGFVVTEKGVVVIDTTKTLADAAFVLRQISTVTDKPVRYVIDTHFHGDHVFGNQLFDAPIIASDKDADIMRAMLQKDWSAEGLPKIINTWNRPEELEGLRIVLPQITFGDTLTLDMGDVKLELVHLGGHTPGSCIVYVRKQQILFIGDLLFVGRYPALISFNLDEWIAALDYVKTLPVETVIPGHGPVSTMKEVEAIQVYLKDLKGRITSLAKQELSREEIIAHPSFPRYAEKTYATTHRVNIGFAYDQIVGKKG